MKLLIALSVLASTTVFAQSNGHSRHDFIKCYENPQETGRNDVVYKFKEEKLTTAKDLYKKLKLVYPWYAQLEREDGCLVNKRENGILGTPVKDNTNPRHEFEACLGEGQEIRGLVPVEIEDEREDFEGTVYCEEEIEDWFEHQRGPRGDI